MKKLVLALAAFLSALVFAAPSFAQTGDAQIDGNAHPNVGALLAKRSDKSLTIVCSGTLVTPRVFLTAGHCTDFLINGLGQTDAYVTFDPNFGTDSAHNILSTPYHGQLITNPDWHQPYQNDTAIVLLDAPVRGITPARLAPVGFLDELKKAGTINDVAFTNVGYGTAEKVKNQSGAPDFPFDGIRKWTISGYHSLNTDAIHLDQSLARGLSGTGYGDSGGPTFVDSANGPVVISVVSTGDTPCYSTSVNARVDTQDARDFLAPYLAMT